MSTGKNAFQIMFVLWASFLASVIFYSFVGYLVFPNKTDEFFVLPSIFVLYDVAFTAAAIMLIPIVFYIPSILLKSSFENSKKDVDPSKFGEIFPIVFTPFVVRIALIEGIGVLGLVLAFMTESPGKAAPFSLIAIILFGIFFPSAQKLKNRIETLNWHKDLKKHYII
jgi:hypothetical protein